MKAFGERVGSIKDKGCRENKRQTAQGRQGKEKLTPPISCKP